MHEIVATLTVVTGLACMLASFVLESRFGRHLFAWVSAAYVLKATFMVSGHLDENYERYIQDALFSIIFIAFSAYAMIRFPRCRLI